MTTFRPSRYVTHLLVAAVCAAAHAVVIAAESPAIHFNRDVRPILADNCFACHGPDAAHRKAKLRLDTKEGLFEGTAKRDATVIPGNLEKSELWLRVATTNLDDRMPPEDSHKVLKPEQIDTLKRWILAGAPWQGHWAFVKPEPPAVPTKFKTSSSRFKVRNPVDAFILAALEGKGLQPNTQADMRSLARRVSLDLTGLPPSPEELRAFLADRSPDAYEKFVKKLLASPRYGEHRGRYWLDAARYSDTHGLHFDNYREIWPYRDWVINAFNSNKPLDQFTVEQLAGDLLPDATDDQKTATGFQRCSVTTNEGGTIEDENLANVANDRVSTTGWVFMGLTMNCASCHDHKFDPITAKDFYSMAAFYRNTTQSGFDKNLRESDVFMYVPQTDSDRARWKALPGELDTARKARAEQEAAAESDFTNWLATVKAEKLPRTVDLKQDHLRVRLNEGDGTNISGFVTGQSKVFNATAQFDWQGGGPLGAAPVFAPDKTITIGDTGDFESKEPFSFGAWVKVPKDFKGEGSVIAKMAGQDENYRGWELFVRDQEFGTKMIHRWSAVAMEVRSTGKVLKPGEWQHLFVTHDGTGRSSGVRLFVNGVEVQANRDNNRLEGTIRVSHPLRIGRREKKNELKNVAVQDVRIVRRRLSSVEVRAISVAPRAAQLLAEFRAQPTNAAPKDALRSYFHVTQHQGWRAAHAALSDLEFEQQTLRARTPVTLVQVEKAGSEPSAHILFRGEYDKRRDKVTADVPASLPPLPENAPKNRLGLAQWMVAPENPLTARVTVNRFWQEIFGVGLVKTVEDFGLMGESPSHPELLDWLAVEFRESGWDVKKLFELIVTSSAYRQGSEVTPEKLEKDPQNRMVSRGPRFRLDAEMIRDSALAASGLLVEKVGGPSVKPYQPIGIWEAVAMPESNTRFYEQGKGPDLYRRSMYTFWKRAAPPATMDIFNAPSREVCTVRRERTNTPLQALATLNDPQFLEAARHLAERALLSSKDEEDAIQAMAERLLARSLSSKERSITEATLKRARSYYETEPDAAKSLISIGESKPSDKLPPQQLAAMTIVANQLMNLDEALTK